MSDVRELRRKRSRDGVREPVVFRHIGDVEEEHAAGSESRAGQLEELLRREVEGHVRRPIGVGEDEVEARLGAPEERPRVGGDHVEARVVVEAEEAAADRTDLSVELDAVDPGLRIEDTERPGSRPACVAENGD